MTEASRNRLTEMEERLFELGVRCQRGAVAEFRA